MANLLEALGSRIVVGDGAVAAYLYAEGVPLGRSFEGMNLTDPDRVSAAHRIYLEAGAEVIATNSFAANRACLRRHGLEEKVSEINWKAAKLALGEVGKSGAWVVGTMGPSGIPQAEWGGAKEVEELFRKQAGALLDGGVHAILLQSFSDPKELSLAMEAVRELHHLPILALLAAGREGTLPEGKSWEETTRKLRDAGAEVIGVAPAFGPSACEGLMKRISSGPDHLLAAYPDAGQPEFSEGRYLYANHPDYFAQRMAELPALGVNLLGGGSGVSPAHIRALKAKVSGLKPTTQVRAAVEPKREAIQISHGAGQPKREESILDRLKKERIAVVELDSPRGLDMGPFFKAAEE